MIDKTEEKKMEGEIKEKTEKKMEGKTPKEETKKVEKKEIVKKDLAVANGHSLRISPKHAVAICKVIRGKDPSAAVMRLQAVIDERRAIPMASAEVAHQKGKGLAGAKYPKTAAKEIMNVVRQAGANAIVNGIENPIITIAKADRAPAPYRKGGRKAKRAHVHLEIREKTSLTGGKK
jgi:ribosomal protein L22